MKCVVLLQNWEKDNIFPSERADMLSELNISSGFGQLGRRAPVRKPWGRNLWNWHYGIYLYFFSTGGAFSLQRISLLHHCHVTHDLVLLENAKQQLQRQGVAMVSVTTSLHFTGSQSGHHVTSLEHRPLLCGGDSVSLFIFERSSVSSWEFLFLPHLLKLGPLTAY